MLPSAPPRPTRSAIATPADAERAVIPVSKRVAALLRPIETIPRYGDHGYDGGEEIWHPQPIEPADIPELRQQLAMVSAALRPGEPGAILARVLALLAQYRERDPLPAAVEAAIAEDWLDDLGEWPLWVVVEAARRWRRHPVKYRFKPLPGDLRALCREIVGDLPTVARRLRTLLGENADP